MKNRLIILSDLWGVRKSAWLNNYTNILNDRFDIQYYDSCILGEIDISDYNGENLHQQFVNGGIEIAVDNMMKLEKDPIDVFAFSIGGVIAWKFGIRSDNLKTLTCVSSTRLRKEIKRPKGRVDLYYGNEDDYKPSQEWLDDMNVHYEIILNRGHDLYTDTEFSGRICRSIIDASEVAININL